MCAFIPLVLVPPERLQVPFAISFVLFGSSCIGILIWYAQQCCGRIFLWLINIRAVKNAGGPGTMFHEPGNTENVGWAFMFGITGWS